MIMVSDREGLYSGLFKSEGLTLCNKTIVGRDKISGIISMVTTAVIPSMALHATRLFSPKQKQTSHQTPLSTLLPHKGVMLLTLVNLCKALAISISPSIIL